MSASAVPFIVGVGPSVAVVSVAAVSSVVGDFVVVVVAPGQKVPISQSSNSTVKNVFGDVREEGEHEAGPGE